MISRLLQLSLVLIGIFISTSNLLGSTVNLTTTTNPYQLGRAITLTAQVSEGATGKVTFYDGARILGVRIISGNKATLTTTLLGPGNRTLRARYWGDSTNAPANSGGMGQTILAVPAADYILPITVRTPATDQSAMVVADFNSDNKQDVATADRSTGLVSILLLGTSLGGGQLPVTYPAGGSAYGLVAGDWNSDGNVDLAVADAPSHRIALLSGNGDGTFRAPTFITNASFSHWLKAADFNGDGRADLLSSSEYYAPSVFFGNGNGTFGAAVSIPGISTAMGMPAVDDFNRDGYADIIFGPRFGPIQSVTGNPNGTFGAPVQTFGDGWDLVTTGDFVRNSQVGLASTRAGVTSIRLGSGDGTFQNPIVSFNGTGPASFIATGGLNGDGILDLAFDDGPNGTVSMLGDGNGGMRVRNMAGMARPIVDGTLTDINGDGKADMITASSNLVDVWLGGAPDLAISLSSNLGFYPGQSGTYQVVVSNPGDMPTLGVVEVVNSIPPGVTVTSISGSGWTCSISTRTCSRFDSLPMGSAYPAISISVTVEPTQSGNRVVTTTVSGLRDMNLLNNSASGALVIAYASSTDLSVSPAVAVLGQNVQLTATVSGSRPVSGKVTFFDSGVPLGNVVLSGTQATLTTRLLPNGLRNITATFSGNPLLAPSTSPVRKVTVNSTPSSGFGSPASFIAIGGDAIISGDFNRDGKTDLALLNVSEGALTVATGGGDGTFRTATFVGIGSPVSMTPGDFNGDGKLDLILGQRSSPALTLLVGIDNGPFTLGPNVATEGEPSLVAAADVNGDSILDLIVSSGKGKVLLGNGDGSFRPGSEVTWPGTAMALLAADLNGDGKADIVTGERNTVLLAGNGDGSFQPAMEVSPASPRVIAAGDLNGDSYPDLVIASVHTGLSVSVYVPATNRFSPVIGDFAIGSSLMGLALADVNADGRLDVVATYLSDKVQVFFGNGDGTLKPPANYPHTGYAEHFTIGDFNGDGRPDVAVAVRSEQTVQLFLGIQKPVIQVSSSHAGNFLVNQIGASYTLTASNGGSVPVTGLVTVVNTLPVGLTATSMTGPGWTCALATLTCTQQAANLAPGSSLPPISLTVTVTITTPSQVINRVTASSPDAFGGESIDVTDITVLQPPSLVSPANGQSVGDTTSLVWNASAGATSYDVYLGLSQNPVFVGFTTNTSYTSGKLTTGSTYYWKVIAKGPTGSATSETRRLVVTPANYAGSVDVGTCSGIAGWAADRNRLNVPITVTLWDGATQIASVLANGLRPDVGSAIGDNGLHGFSIAIPPGYADGLTRQLQVRFETSGTQLASSPITIKCGGSLPKDYAGYVDSASCSGISGWALDRNRLNQSINVTLWDGESQVASTMANAYRGDVGGLFGDNGMHGFAIPIPQSLSDGISRRLQVRFESSTTQFGSSPFTIKCATGGSATPNFVGYVDSVSCSGGISGWAADRNRLNQPIQISLWDGNTRLTSAIAGTSRPDVGQVLGDSGQHGFTIPLPVGYSDNVQHSLQVRFEDSATQLSGSPARFTCQGPGGGGSTPLYAGWVDATSCSAIHGWAADRNRLNQVISVDLVEGSSVLATILANGSRPDVGAVLGDNGLHAFLLTPPSSLKDGTAHSIQLRYSGTTTPIPNSPQTLQCSGGGSGGVTPNYDGYVDQMGCSVISGWAADRNRPNIPIDLQIFEGATLLATVTASQPRSDLVSYLGDNGAHGFGFATPSSVKDGRPHTLTIRPVGSTTALGGARTLTCP